MGHDLSAETQKLQKQNLASFEGWLKTSGHMVMPIPHRAVIYAGFPPGDLMTAKKVLTSSDQMRRMWQIIETVEKQIREVTGQVSYDKLNDVLKRLTGPLPKLVEATGANIGHPKKFANMLDCAERLTDSRWALIDKGKFNHVWDKLSEQYVKNSSGDVEIWEGRKANYKRIDASTTLIRAELNALLAREDLPKATRLAAEKLVVGYVKHHHDQKQFSEKTVTDALASLRAAKKH
jgi:hypothetical protein